jgi:hypothetical protein
VRELGFVRADKEGQLATGRIDNFGVSGRFLIKRTIRAVLRNSHEGAAFVQHSQPRSIARWPNEAISSSDGSS